MQWLRVLIVWLPYFVSRQLNHVEAAELLRQEAVKIQNEAQEIH
jgi:hypothetical protein